MEGTLLPTLFILPLSFLLFLLLFIQMIVVYVTCLTEEGMSFDGGECP